MALAKVHVTRGSTNGSRYFTRDIVKKSATKRRRAMEKSEIRKAS